MSGRGVRLIVVDEEGPRAGKLGGCLLRNCRENQMKRSYDDGEKRRTRLVKKLEFWKLFFSSTNIVLPQMEN